MDQVRVYKWVVGMLLSLVIMLVGYSYTQLNDRVFLNVTMTGELTKTVAVLASMQSQDSKERVKVLQELALARESINANHDSIILMQAKALQYETMKETQAILKNLELLVGGIVFQYQSTIGDNK